MVGYERIFEKIMFFKEIFKEIFNFNELKLFIVGDMMKYG